MLRDPPPTPPEASRKTKKSKVSIYSAQCNKNKQRQEVPFHWSRGCALDSLDHVSNISLTFQRDVTMVSFYRYGLQRSFDRNPEGKSFCYFLNFSPFPKPSPQLLLNFFLVFFLWRFLRLKKWHVWCPLFKMCIGTTIFLFSYSLHSQHCSFFAASSFLYFFFVIFNDYIVTIIITVIYLSVL